MILWPLITLLIFLGGVLSGYFFDVGGAADGVRLEISPSGWTFSIWGFIYLWQFIWICYVLFLCCKYEMNTIIFGKWLFIAYNAANISGDIWTYVWINGYLWWSTVFILGISIPLVVASYIAHDYLHRVASTAVVSEDYGASNANNSDEFDAESSLTESIPKWLVDSSTIKPLLYIFVANGIAFYATWTVVASHLGVGIALCHGAGLSNTATSFLMLSILSCIILFYWFLDFFKLRSYLQYTYSPYIVLIVAFTGILTNGGLDVDERPSSPFVLALLVIAVLGTVAKVIMGICLRNQPVAARKSLDSV